MDQHQTALSTPVLQERPHLARVLADAEADAGGIFVQTEITAELEPSPGRYREALWRDAGLEARYRGVVRPIDLADPPHSEPALGDECFAYLPLVDHTPRLLAHILGPAWHPGGDEGPGAALAKRIRAAGLEILPPAAGIIRGSRTIAWARGRTDVVPRDLRLAAAGTVTEELWAVLEDERAGVEAEMTELRTLDGSLVRWARTVAWLPPALVPRDDDPWHRVRQAWAPLQVPVLDWHAPEGRCLRPDSRWLTDQTRSFGRYTVHFDRSARDPVSIEALCRQLPEMTWDALVTAALRHHRVRTTSILPGGRVMPGPSGVVGEPEDSAESAEDEEDTVLPWARISAAWRRAAGSGTGGDGADEALRDLEERARVPPRELFAELRTGLAERIHGHEEIIDELCLLAILHIRGGRSPRVLLRGAPGVGKTHALRALAEVIGVPVQAAEAPQISETSYRGIQMGEFLEGVLGAAQGSAALASRALIILDEFDKLRAHTGDDARSKSKAYGQQSAFLSLLGGGTPLMTERGSGRGPDLRSDRMMVVCAGAFGKLEIAGEHPTTEELVRYGIMHEIADRLQRRIVMRPRGVEDTVRMLRAAAGRDSDTAKLCEELDIEIRIADETYQYAAQLAVADEISPRESIGWIERAVERLLMVALRGAVEGGERVITPDDLRR